MKKKVKQILSALLVAVMLVGVIPLSASAAYENTYTNTGNQRDDIIGVAKTQLGYTEGANNATKYGTWYGLPNQPWCAMFISWCARQAGISKNILQNSAVAAPDAKYFNIPYYDGASYTPQKGDLFFTKSWSHVGLVYYVDGSYFYTIEGNSNTTGSSEGTSVVTNRRKISNFYFGVPKYNSGAPTYAKLSIDAKSLYVGQTITFTCDSDTADYYNIGIDRNGSRILLKKVGHLFYYKCDKPGSYTAYVSAVNSNGYIDSNKVSWKVYMNEYVISYNLNGGTGSIASQTKTHDTNLTLTATKPTGKSFTVTYNANGGTVSTSSKTVAQTFTNWNTAANGSGTAYNAGATYSANASVTLYAQYANPSIGSLPTPTRSGYAFDGWYTAANGGTKIIDSTKVTANTTVYAHWKANAYTVFYNANGGSNVPASQSKTHDVNLTLSSAKPTGKSFTVSYNANGGNVSSSSKTVAQTFTNWNTAANGNGTTYNAGATYSANANVTLYAQYANPSIGSLPTPTRSGYNFDGWYTSANGGTKITDSTKVTANTTVYAHWKANAYTVSYNVNGGTSSIASQTKTHNTNLTLTTAKPTGKSFTVTYNANGGTVSTSSKTVAQTFTNWNTAANGNGTTYNAGATYSANANVTLYAQYANPSIGSLPTPTRSGYNFDGWYTSANGGTKITDSTKVTSNTTVYAHWTKNAETKAVVEDVKIEHNATVNYKSTYMLSPEITADKGAKYTVKYSSSNTKVATVDENGKIYGAKKGNATITCTVTDSYGNIVTDKCNVNVDYSGAQWFIIIVLFGWIWYI